MWFCNCYGITNFNPHKNNFKNLFLKSVSLIVKLVLNAFSMKFHGNDPIWTFSKIKKMIFLCYGITDHLILEFIKNTPKHIQSRNCWHSRPMSNCIIWSNTEDHKMFLQENRVVLTFCEMLLSERKWTNKHPAYNLRLQLFHK